jgi:hypothetical protein
MTVEAQINSETVGGIIAAVKGFPAGIDPIEGDWYEWGADYGDILQDESGLFKQISFDLVGGAYELAVSALGFDMDDLIEDGDLSSKSGLLATCYFQASEDMEFGTYELIRGFSVSGSDTTDGMKIYLDPVPSVIVDPAPVSLIDPIVIWDIPEYDALELPESVELISTGGVMSLPINMLNKDSVASGSFKITYPGEAMALTGVTPGSRAGNMDFSIADYDTATVLAAAGDVTATVEFSGDTIEMGSLGDLCSLDFSVSGVSAGSSVSLSLADVVLNDGAGAPLADLQQPTVGTTAPDMFFGDSLIVGVMPGAFVPDQTEQISGIALIEDGMLKVPILMTNSVAVLALEFYVTKESANDSISLVLNDIEVSSRISGWLLDMNTAKDTVDFVHVVGVKTTTGSAIAVGSGEIMTLVFEIMGHEGVISLDRSIDITMDLRGVNVGDANGDPLTVQEIPGVATVDYRVPVNSENIAAGASLPQAFALGQNHPNPFNPSTTINYQVPEDAGMAKFTLNVYDIRGRLVRTLENGTKGPGYYTAYWDGTDNRGRQVSSGVYFYRFSSKDYTATRKMVLLK